MSKVLVSRIFFFFFFWPLILVTYFFVRQFYRICRQMIIMIWFCYNGCRYSFTKAFCMAFVMTSFSIFDVSVFWPILLCYWIVLFVIKMRHQNLKKKKGKMVLAEPEAKWKEKLMISKPSFWEIQARCFPHRWIWRSINSAGLLRDRFKLLGDTCSSV